MLAAGRVPLLANVGDGAEKVLGLEPSLLYCAQFESLQTYMQNDNISVLPLRLEDLPARTGHSIRHFRWAFCIIVAPPSTICCG